MVATHAARQTPHPSMSPQQRTRQPHVTLQAVDIAGMRKIPTTRSNARLRSLCCRRATLYQSDVRYAVAFVGCTIDFSIMTWIPFEPLTAWVTRKSAARLQSV